MSPAVGTLLPLAQGHSRDRVYAIRRGGTNDLLSSTTGGAVWDTIGPNTGRAMNLYEPGPNHLWMMTARDTVAPIPNPWYIRQSVLCDTFYYSSDDGLTWVADDTFAGDTVCMMSWSAHDLGYVLGKRDGRTYVARFVPNAKSDVRPVSLTHDDVIVSPNPFTDHITITSADQGEVTVTLHDALGRVHYADRLWINGSARLPLGGSLPPGIYVLSVLHGGEQRSIRLVHH